MTEPTKQEFYQAYLSGELTPTSTKITNIFWYSPSIHSIESSDDLKPSEDTVSVVQVETYSFGNEVWKVETESIDGQVERLSIER